jgi:hypothetical protein
MDSTPTGDDNMQRFVQLVSFVLALSVFVGFAHAHHSQAGIFDSKKTIEVTASSSQSRGEPAWTDPPVREGRKRCRDVWDTETASISILRNRGVDGSSIKVGDRVTIAGSPSLRNRPELLARSMLLSNGYEFTFGSADAYFPAGKAGRLIGRAKPM